MGEINLLPKAETEDEAIDRIHRLLPVYKDAISRGLLDENEIRSAFVRQEVMTLPGARAEPPLNVFRTADRLQSLSTHAAQRLLAAKEAQDLNPITAAGKSFVAELERIVLGGGAIAADAFVGAASLLPGSNVEFKPNLEGRQKLFADIVGKVAGIPTEPFAQAVYEEQFPALSRLAGVLGAFGVVSIAAPAVASTRAASLLNRVTPITKLGVTTRVGAAGLGATGGILIAPDDADGLEKALFAIGGAAGAQLLPSILMGRPFTAEARRLFLLERGAGSKLTGLAGVRARSASIGRAILASPRSTFGHLASSGTQGAIFGATHAASQGKPFHESLAAGVREGGLFIAGDLLLSRLGTVTRSLDFMTRFNIAAENTIKELSFFKSRPAAVSIFGASAQFAADTLAGGALGAGIATAAGGDASAGFQIGLTGGAGFTGTRFLRDAFSRYAAFLPAETIKKAFEGRTFTPEEVGMLSGIITRDTAATIARDFPTAFKALVEKATGPFVPLTDDIARAEAQIGTAQARIYGASPLEDFSATQVTEGFSIFQSRELVARQRKLAQGIADARVTEQTEAIRKIMDRVAPQRTTTPRITGTSDKALRGSSITALKNLRHFLPPALRRNNKLAQDAFLGINRTLERARGRGKAFDERGGLTLEELSTRVDSLSSDVIAVESRASEVVPRVSNRVFKREAAREVVRSLDDNIITKRTTRVAGGRGILGETAAERIGERGAATVESVTGILGGGAGAVVGVPVGAALEQLIDNDDGTNAWGGLIGGLTGLVLGTALGARAGGFALSRFGDAASKQALKFFKATDETLLPRVDKRLTRVGSRDITTNDFFRFNLEDQFRHLRLRLESIQVAESAANARRRFEATLSKFTPTAITVEDFDLYAKTVLAGSKRLGIDDVSAFQLLRGSLARMAYKPVARKPTNSNLRLLARDSRLMGEASTLKDLKAMVDTADVITGAEAAAPSYLVRNRDKINRIIMSPNLQRFKEIVKRADERDTLLRGTPGYTVTGGSLLPFLSRLSPPTHFFRIAERLAADAPGTSRDVREFTQAIFQTTGRMTRAIEDSHAELRRIFAHVSKTDRMKVRSILEDPARLEATRVTNPNLHDAALNFRKLLNTWADRAGLPANRKIEEYFPWIYNLETIERLRRRSTAPGVEDMFFHVGGSIPEHKIVKNLLERTRNTPAGPVLEDPFEVGSIYLTGVVRKVHLDPLAVRFDEAFFKQVASSGQEALSRDMARWYTDVWGIPSQQYMRVAASLKNAGNALEVFHQFNQASFLGRFINRYANPIESFLKNPAATARLVTTMRAIPVYSKLAGNFISGAVNLAQFVINGGTDMGLDSIFIGGPKFMGQAMAGKFGESVARRAEQIVNSGGNAPVLEQVSGFLNHTLGGESKLKLARDLGVGGLQSRRILNEIASSQARVGTTRLRGGAAGAITGAIGSQLVFGEEDERSALIGGVIGGALLGAAVPSVLKRALFVGRDAAMMPFNLAEITNRSMVAGGAVREVAKSEALRTGARSVAASRALEIAEFTGLGAVTGATTGAAFADPGERKQAATAGAGLGAGLGFGIGAVSKSRSTRVGKELAELRERGNLIPGVRESLIADGPLTIQELETAYARQVIDQTQFLLSRTGRPEIMREPYGEVLGALQSFTLNQFEFTGARMSSMLKSIREGGKVDTRFLRFAMLTTAMSATYQNISISADADTSTEYWMSRFSLGILPLLQYNRRAERWQVRDIGEQLQGPVISDMLTVANFMWTMATDPKAQSQYNVQIDELANDLFIALGQVESNEERLGSTFEALGLEGLQELMEARRLSNFAANPFTTTERGGASPERRSEVRSRGVR